MLVNLDGKLEGIFTDSDLARLLEQRRESDLDNVIENLMTRSFSAVQSGAKLLDAIDIMVQNKISELPVVDMEDKPLGMIDITDILGIEHDAANALQRNVRDECFRSAEEENESIEWHNGPTTLRLFGSEG
jgi:arabinose-5-phosphate isomerase